MITYSQFKKLRRKFNSEIICEELYKNGLHSYLLKSNFNGIISELILINGTQEYLDFTNELLPFVNEPIILNPDVIWTHDFSDNSQWSSTSNSLYCIVPKTYPTNKILELKEFRIFCDKDINFNNQDIIVTIWISINSECPQYQQNIKTEYNNPQNQFSPGNSGWAIDALPWNGQEVTHYVFLDEYGNAQYACIEFKYSSIEDLLAKSKYSINGNILIATFKFETHIDLRPSKNERIEAFLSNNSEIISPNLKPSRAILDCFSKDDI